METEPNVAEMSVHELVDAYNKTDKPNIFGEELLRRIIARIQSGNGWK